MKLLIEARIQKLKGRQRANKNIIKKLERKLRKVS